MSICENYNYLLHNEITDDILVTIPDAALPALCNVFKQNYPYAVQAYQFVKQMISWKRKYPDIGIRFTCPEGRWQDGTFVAIFTERAYNIFFFALNGNYNNLCRALRRTRLIEWSKGPYICALQEDYANGVMETLRLVGLVQFTIESTTWWLPKEVALTYNISCPDDVYIASLEPKHASIVNSQWPHAFPGSEIYLANLITINKTCGIFTKSQDKLVSWVLLNEFGAHSILQTLSEYKRKGYAALLVKKLAKDLAELGSDSVTYIVRKNVVSQKLFTGLGFRKVNEIRWIQFKEIVGKDLRAIAHL